jgi:hypothetical protein
MCKHQATINPGRAVISATDSRGSHVEYVIPDVKDGWYPFDCSDIVAFKTSLFRGFPSTFAFELSTNYEPSPTLSHTILGFYPSTGQFCTSGVADLIKNGNTFNYANSTGNGSCGTPLIVSKANTFSVFSIHSQTSGGGPRPNSGYGFLLKKKD